MTLAIPPIPRRANVVSATFALLFMRRRYEEMAQQQELWVNVSSEDLRQRYERGDYPNLDWVSESMRRARSGANKLRRGLWSSFWWTCSFLLIGVVIASVLGKVDPSLPVAHGKILSTVGGMLAAWATLFELGGYVDDSFSGETLDELVRPMLFRAVFLPGLVIATIGQLW